MSETFLIEKLEKEVDSLPSTKNEITQHLVELGYLSMLRLNAMLEKDIDKAKMSFLQDLGESELFSPLVIIAHKNLPQEEFLTKFLRTLTDIDEGLKLDQLPGNGTVSLSTRMIHYRLELLGLWEHPIESPFSTASIIALEQLGGYLKLPSLESVNLMRDVEALTKHLLTVREDREFILTFNVPDLSEDEIKKLERRRAFKRQLKQDFAEKDDFFKKLNRDVLRLNDKKIDYSFLHKESRNPFKKFVARLIQIHQWQDGFYESLIDAHIGPFTLKSTLQTIDFYNQLDKRDIKTHRVLTYLEQGYFLFNALFFLQEYMIEEGKIGHEEEFWGRLAGKLIQTDAKSQQNFTNNLEDIKVSVTQNSNNPPKERKGLLQRVYAGVKRVIRKALRFFNKIFKWLITNIKKAFKFLSKIFKSFFETLSAGIKAFLNGIKFLLGKKQLMSTEANGFVYSQWKLDADAFSLSNGASKELMASHIKRANYEWATLKFALVIVGSILQIISRSLNVLSWPFLILTIARTFKRISASYQTIITN